MSAPVGHHTILLIQQTENPASRTYYDFENRTQLVEGVLKLHEEALKTIYSDRRTITYDVADVYAFIDGFQDISCLTQHPSTGLYEPHDREYIKTAVYRHLTALAK